MMRGGGGAMVFDASITFSPLLCVLICMRVSSST